jgi:hypothetical protein
VTPLPGSQRRPVDASPAAMVRPKLPSTTRLPNTVGLDTCSSRAGEKTGAFQHRVRYRTIPNGQSFPQWRKGISLNALCNIGLKAIPPVVFEKIPGNLKFCMTLKTEPNKT